MRTAGRARRSYHRTAHAASRRASKAALSGARGREMEHSSALVLSMGVLLALAVLWRVPVAMPVQLLCLSCSTRDSHRL